MRLLEPGQLEENCGPIAIGQFPSKWPDSSSRTYCKTMIIKHIISIHHQLLFFLGAGRFRADEVDEYKLVRSDKHKGGIIGEGGMKEQLDSDQNEETAYEAGLAGHLEVPSEKDQNRDGERHRGNQTQVGLGVKIDINRMPGESSVERGKGRANGSMTTGEIGKMENGGTNVTDSLNKGTANGFETTSEIDKMENKGTNVTDNENEKTATGFETTGEIDKMENGGTNLTENENEGTANGFETTGEIDRMENGGTNLTDNDNEGTSNRFETTGEMENGGTILRDNKNEQGVPFEGEIESLDDDSVDKYKGVTIRQTFPNIANENTVLGLAGGAMPFEERQGSIIDEPGTTAEANLLRNEDSSRFTGIPFVAGLTGEATPLQERPGPVIEERGTRAEANLLRSEDSSKFTGIPLFAGVDGRAETRSVKGNSKSEF